MKEGHPVTHFLLTVNATSGMHYLDKCHKNDVMYKRTEIKHKFKINNFSISVICTFAGKTVICHQTCDMYLGNAVE